MVMEPPMKHPALRLAVPALALLVLPACATLQRGQTVAEYCADPRKGGEAVCQLKIEIDGQSTALADTNMRLSDAQTLAAAANDAAMRAQSSADAAMLRAEAAMEDPLVCETRTIQRANTGTCREGYALTSCTQTRFTYAAGGPSILREINDQQCRFNDRVLEMQVRCCGLASQVPEPRDEVIDMRRGAPVSRPATTAIRHEEPQPSY
jgi:hypothetical protein